MGERCRLYPWLQEAAVRLRVQWLAKMGACDKEITVEMPGGEIGLIIDDEFNVNMTGPATRVATMELDQECLKD